MPPRRIIEIHQNIFGPTPPRVHTVKARRRSDFPRVPAVYRAVSVHTYVDQLAPLPDGVAEFLRTLAEEAGSWPDADAVPCPLPSGEEI